MLYNADGFSLADSGGDRARVARDRGSADTGLRGDLPVAPSKVRVYLCSRGAMLGEAAASSSHRGVARDVFAVEPKCDVILGRIERPLREGGRRAALKSTRSSPIAAFQRALSSR